MTRTDDSQTRTWVWFWAGILALAFSGQALQAQAQPAPTEPTPVGTTEEPTGGAVQAAAEAAPESRAERPTEPKVRTETSIKAPNDATVLPRRMVLMAGGSRVVALPRPVERVSVGHPGVVDVMLTGNRELYVLGRGIGVSNIMLWTRGAGVSVVDVQVEMDVGPLQRQIQRVFPQETQIDVQAAADSVVLSGTVSNIVKAEQVMALAQGHVRSMARQAHAAASVVGTAGRGEALTDGSAGQGPTGTGAAAAGRNPAMGATLSAGAQAFGGSAPHVINLLQIRQPQQVMLEVKVAEVSRNLLEQLGVSLDLSRTVGSMSYGLFTQSLQDVFGRLLAVGRHGRVSVEGKEQNGLIRVLAEPNIVAISGHEGSFLAGGKVFIPVARDTQEGRSTITLEEKEFGVSLRFTPQVMEGDVVQLRVAPEVSELTRTGSPFLSTGGVTAVLPSFSTRRASTTVQLRDGQSLAIAGLIKNNATETLTKFPFLGDIPILGALFRSKEFQTDNTELLFIITPRLVKALPPGGPSVGQGPGQGKDPSNPEPALARRLQTLDPQSGQDPQLPDRLSARDALAAREAAQTGAKGSGGRSRSGSSNEPLAPTPAPLP